MHYANRLMSFIQLIKQIKHDSGACRICSKRMLSSYLFNPSFRLLLNYRLGSYLSKSKFKLGRLIALFLKNRMYIKRNCQISYNALIGKGVVFAHPIGIVIGDGVVIKDNVRIWQNVTLGSTGKIGVGLSYPIVENNVRIYAGAKVLGKITLGKDSIIGANAVVLSDIPEKSVAVGIPARIRGKSL